jgi:hypothetical protein
MTLPSFPNIDLFSAGINALNGVLVARNPSHDRNYTMAGLLIMAFFGGIGGGVSRDVLYLDGLARHRHLPVSGVKRRAVSHPHPGLLQVVHAAMVRDPWRSQGTRSWAGSVCRHRHWIDLNRGRRSLHRPVLRRHAGNCPAVRAACHNSGAGERGLYAAGLALYESRRIFPHHHDCGDGRLSISRDCCARALAVHRSCRRCAAAAQAGVSVSCRIP